MKARIVLLGSLVLVGLCFSSCKKDDNGTSYKYSNLTVEENKANIEDNGIAMLNEVKTLESGEYVDASINMVNYMSLGDLFSGNPNMNPVKAKLFTQYIQPVVVTANLKDFNAKRVATSLKLNLSEETLVSIWNDVKGTYTWHASDSTWSFAAGNEIRILFPSTEGGTTNNVVFRVYDFTYQNGPFSWMGSYVGEMPTQIKSELKVDNDVLLSYSLNIAYNNTDKKPSSFNTTLILTPFVFSLEASNSDSKASVTFKFNNASTTLVMLSLNAKGNWSESNLNTDPAIGDVFYGGNATFQLMGIKIVGDVDYTTINNKMENISEDLPDSAYVAQECSIINSNAKLWVCYTENNTIIAKVKVYPVKRVETWDSCEFNYDTQTWEWVTYTDEYFDKEPRLEFSDNSNVDIDTYFSEGFSDIIGQFEAYMSDLQSRYFANK